MGRRDLSTTDFTVLGIVWRDGPCTTYTIMLLMARSPSSFYRKRASSTYSVVQKLTTAGLLEPIGDEVGTRKERLIRITEEGLAVLRKWLSPPIPESEAAYSNDLIRLRLNFVAALQPAEQAALVEDALTMLHKIERDQEQGAEKISDPIRALTILGLLYETRARITWLEHVKSVLPLGDPTLPE